jgi:hypothetical protein
MISKERVYSAIEFRNPDRIPYKVDFISPEAVHDTDYASIVKEIENDLVHNPAGWYYEGCKLGTNTDEWGCTWSNLKEGNLGQVVGHPLADTQTIELGPPPVIDIQTKEEISLLGRFNGGLVACITLENNKRYKALTKAFLRYGNYW